MAFGKCSVCEAKDAELVFLRDQLAKLQESLIRIRRVEEGLPEQPPVPRRLLPSMPRELVNAIHAAFESPATRDDQMRAAERKARKDGTWDNVVSYYMELVGGDDA